MAGGGAERYPDYADRTKKSSDDVTDIYSLIRTLAFSPTRIQSPIPGAGFGGVESYLRTRGDTMIGPIAFSPRDTAIDSNGRIDISEDTADDYSTYVLVTGMGSPDDLRVIEGAAFNGQYLILQGTATQTINLKHATIRTVSNITGTGTVTVTTTVDHGYSTSDLINIVGTVNFDVQDVSITVTGLDTFTYSDAGDVTPESTGTVQPGNIVTGDGTDVTLTGGSNNDVPIAVLIFDVTVAGFGAWRLVGGTGSGGGVGGIQDPIITKDNGDITTPGPAANLDWSAVGGNFHRHTVTGDVAFTMTGLPATGEYEQMVLQITQDATGGHDVIFSDTFLNNNVPLIATGPNDITTLVFYTYDDGTDRILGFNTTQLSSIIMSMSDEKTSLDVPSGVDQFTTFRMPYGMTLTEVRADLRNAGTGSVITVDVRESGTTIFSTLLTIDAGDTTSVGATTAAVISDSALADNAEMKLFLTTRDSGNTATGLKLTLIGFIT